jgi:hypothetical protein
VVLEQTQLPTTHDVAKVIIQCGHITQFKCNVYGGLKVHNNKGLMTRSQAPWQTQMWV